MKVSNLSPRAQLILTIIVPIFCIAVGLLLVWPVVSHFRKIGRDLEETKATIRIKENVIKQAEEAAGGRPLALAVATADEQEPIVFLQQLAALIKDAGVTMTAVRETAPPPLPANAKQRASTGNTYVNSSTDNLQTSGAASPGQSATGLSGQRPVVPPGVQELTDEVKVEGTFGQLLNLLVRLENFDRILSVSKCRIQTSGAARYPKLQAVFTLSRFVARPEVVTVTEPVPIQSQPGGN